MQSLLVLCDATMTMGFIFEFYLLLFFTTQNRKMYFIRTRAMHESELLLHEISWSIHIWDIWITISQKKTELRVIFHVWFSATHFREWPYIEMFLWASVGLCMHCLKGHSCKALGFYTLPKYAKLLRQIKLLTFSQGLLSWRSFTSSFSSLKKSYSLVHLWMR